MRSGDFSKLAKGNWVYLRFFTERAALRHGRYKEHVCSNLLVRAS